MNDDRDVIDVLMDIGDLAYKAVYTLLGIVGTRNSNPVISAIGWLTVICFIMLVIFNR